MISMNYLDKVVTKNPNVVSRRIADEVVLIPIRKMATDNDFFFVINETGARMWELADGKTRIIEIVNSILDEYDVLRLDAERSALEFFEQLEQLGAVEVA